MIHQIRQIYLKEIQVENQDFKALDIAVSIPCFDHLLTHNNNLTPGGKSIS